MDISAKICFRSTGRNEEFSDKTKLRNPLPTNLFYERC